MILSQMMKGTDIFSHVAADFRPDLGAPASRCDHASEKRVGFT